MTAFSNLFKCLNKERNVWSPGHSENAHFCHKQTLIVKMIAVNSDKMSQSGILWEVSCFRKKTV